MTSWSHLCDCFCDLLIGQFCYDECYTWVVKWVWDILNTLCVRSGIAKRFHFDCCVDKDFEPYFWLSESRLICGRLGRERWQQECLPFRSYSSYCQRRKWWKGQGFSLLSWCPELSCSSVTLCSFLGLLWCLPMVTYPTLFHKLSRWDQWRENQGRSVSGKTEERLIWDTWLQVQLLHFPGHHHSAGQLNDS